MVIMKKNNIIVVGVEEAEADPHQGAGVSEVSDWKSLQALTQIVTQDPVRISGNFRLFRYRIFRQLH